MYLGKRIELHPATDLWMRGARYGTVLRVTRKGALVVQLDLVKRPVKIPRDLVADVW